ncbi:MAG: hypothetical protein K2M44_02140 [Clostridia bacterium]|nr:hypothetical protein [Clostridia bacterium]
MKRSHSYEIALSAISAAMAVAFIVAQAYVPIMTIAINVMAAMAVNLPFTKDMWKGGVLAYVAASGLGFLIVNIKALPFIMLFGAYSVLMWLLDFKFYQSAKLNKIIKIAIIALIKIGFYLLMFWACYVLMDIALDTASIFGKTFNLNFYIVWGVCFAVFCLYDPLIRWVFKCEKALINRIIKKD